MFAKIGILRMIEELEGRRELPRISACVTPPEMQVSLTARCVGLTLVVCAVVLMLGIGHISLRFAMKDLRMQRVALQMQQRELLQSVQALESQNEAMCNPEQLRQYAVERLGMVDR